MKLTVAKSDVDNILNVYRAQKSSIETMELKGYNLIKEFFVDSSGLGTGGEIALTGSSFERETLRLIKKHGTIYAKITNVGQFQVYVGLFTKDGEKKTRKLERNTYEINHSVAHRAIRLHDTDIITYKDNTIILDSGGYETRTTKDRLNKYLPRHVYVYQKNYDWYVVDDARKTTTDFTDKMVLA